MKSSVVLEIYFKVVFRCEVRLTEAWRTKLKTIHIIIVVVVLVKEERVEIAASRELTVRGIKHRRMMVHHLSCCSTECMVQADRLLVHWKKGMRGDIHHVATSTARSIVPVWIAVVAMAISILHVKPILTGNEVKPSTHHVVLGILITILFTIVSLLVLRVKSKTI